MSKRKNRVKLKSSLQGTNESRLDLNAPIDHLHQKVRFSFRDCDTNKNKFCIRILENKEIANLYKKLGHLESHTWEQITKIDHKKGFSIEKKHSPNFQKFSKNYPQHSNFFHFRVSSDQSPFRVFGAVSEGLCYILAIDPKGSINH